MPDIGSIFGGGALQNVFNSPWLNPMLWVVIVLVIVGFAFAVVKLRRRRKLQYPAAEIVDLGAGKFSVNFLGSHGAGWFGKNRKLFGLWDSGPNEVMRIKDMSIVEQFSEVDYQEVNGLRGVVFYRHPQTKNLLPISKFDISNKELLNTLAPVEFTETVVDVIKANENETKDQWEKWGPILAIGLIIVFAVIALIVVSQTFKHSVTEAKDLVLAAGNTCLEGAKQVCSQFGLPASPTAP